MPRSRNMYKEVGDLGAEGKKVELVYRSFKEAWKKREQESYIYSLFP
jgi:hypothetical protein